MEIVQRIDETSLDFYLGSMPNQPPHGILSLPPPSYFREAQPYTIHVDLHVPITPSNVDLGNFMISLSVLDDSSAELHSTSFSTWIPAQPWISAHTLLGLLRGPRTKTISVEMMDGVVLVPGRKKGVGKEIKVWVGRQDMWTSEGKGSKELVTDGGKVRIVGELSGVRFVF